MKRFLLSDTFQDALVKLNNIDQKAVKQSVFDLQQNQSNPGLKFHRINGSKDPNFWSLRVNHDIRLIVHKTKSSFLIAYVGHHDDAYKWAERRRIDFHPRTGGAQIVEVRERVEEISVPSHKAKKILPSKLSSENNRQNPSSSGDTRKVNPGLFLKLSSDDLLNVGVPRDWVEEVKKANEDNLFDLSDFIPDEAIEALMDYTLTGTLNRPQKTKPENDPFAHPDARRRFREIHNLGELEQALKYPWDKWVLYLHPEQRKLVEMRSSGPTRITGSAGTGKTIVALHRATHILRMDPQAKLLLTTFSKPLSNALEIKLKQMLNDDNNLMQRVTILPFEDLAINLFSLVFAHKPAIARREHVNSALSQAVKELELEGYTDRFLMSEWLHIIDAWQVSSLERYARVPRLGRKNRLGNRQREKLWPIFERTKEILTLRHRYTPATVFRQVGEYYQDSLSKPYTHIIVDESQDLGVQALKMIVTLTPDNPSNLFFVGDLGQRIFQSPFSWLGLGINVRGRSHTLKVNYRTSHQIRQTVDKLLPKIIQDVDGIEQDRRGSVSVFNGTYPEVLIHEDENEEVRNIGLVISGYLEDGMLPEEIGVFVRSTRELARARKAVKESGQSPLEISERVEDRNGRIVIGTMHQAKGLEFRYVIVMACDEEILPNQDRIAVVADEVELEEVYNTERHLLYVACTRARENLVVSGVSPASEFLKDLNRIF